MPKIIPFINKCCPRCKRGTVKKFVKPEELEFIMSDYDLNEELDEKGPLMECWNCDLKYYKYLRYDHYEKESKIIDREDFLFDLGECIARFAGQENAMFHCLMYRHLKEKRPVYRQIDIEIEFCKALRRVRIARQELAEMRAKRQMEEALREKELAENDLSNDDK